MSLSRICERTINPATTPQIEWQRVLRGLDQAGNSNKSAAKEAGLLVLTRHLPQPVIRWFRDWRSG